MIPVDERFQRTLGVLDAEGIQRLGQLHILIAGVGGAGGQVAIDLARMGVGRLTLADFDVYVRHNINRQVGCFESTLGQLKVDVVSRMCRDINPAVQIRTVPEGVTEKNCADLLEPSDCPAPDLVVEVIDGASAAAKVCLHAACRKQGLTIMTGIMLGFGASLVVFAPDAPSYASLFVDAEGRIRLASIVPRLGSYMIDEYVANCLAGRGHSPTCVVGATAASALMVTEIIRAALHGVNSMVTWPEYSYLDYFDRIYKRGRFETAP